MIIIKIYKEVATSGDMVDLLNDIATQVKQGILENNHQGWTITGNEEPTIV